MWNCEFTIKAKFEIEEGHGVCLKFEPRPQRAFGKIKKRE